MNFQHLEDQIPSELKDTLQRLTDLTPEQLKTVAEFVVQAGGIEQARAAIEAVSDLSDAA